VILPGILLSVLEGALLFIKFYVRADVLDAQTHAGRLQQPQQSLFPGEPMRAHSLFFPFFSLRERCFEGPAKKDEKTY